MRNDARIVTPLVIIGFVAGVIILRFGRSVLVPLVLSILISYMLEPLVARLQRWRVPRTLGTAVVLVAVTAAPAAGLFALSGEAVKLSQDLPHAARTLRHQIEQRLTGSPIVSNVAEATAEVQQARMDDATGSPSPAREASAASPFDMSSFLWWGSAGLVALAGHAMVVFFLVFFMLLTGPLYRRKLLAIAGPSLSSRRVTAEVLNEIDDQIKRFLLVRLVTSVVVAVATWAALRWIGLEQAAMWGLLAGVGNSIPYLGPVIVSGGLAVVGLVQFGTVTMAAYAAGMALVITSLEGWLLTPPLMGRAARMNALAVLVGLLFWTWVWGAWGTILAVPMLAVTKTICDHIDGLRPVGELLGE